MVKIFANANVISINKTGGRTENLEKKPCFSTFGAVWAKN